MNSVQVHLALTHVPVILSFIGLIILIVAFALKNTILLKTSYTLLLVAGAVALPVFLSGEGAEEAIENLPAVSEQIIESHEEAAKLAMISITTAGIFALAALFSFRLATATRGFKVVLLVLSITTAGLMARAAHLGGQIRHTEIRNGIVIENGNAAGGENVDSRSQQADNNDD